MKKGNTWPAARARWIMGAEMGQRDWPPVWASVLTFAAVFLTEFEGIPIPAFVNQYDCSLGLWRYNPSQHSIVWKGTWTTLLGSGNWWFEQVVNESEWVTRYFQIDLDLDPLHPLMLFKNDSGVDHGNWPRLSPSPIGAANNLRTDLPWISGGTIGMNPATYAEIRSAGIDAENTEPATWTYDGPP